MLPAGSKRNIQETLSVNFEKSVSKVKWNLINIIVLFGILQSLVTSILILLAKKWKEPHNIILIVISFILSLFLIPFFIGNTELIYLNDNLSFLPLDLSLFLFPLLYFYFRSVFDVTFKLDKKKLPHLIIPFVFWFYHFIVWLQTLPVDITSKQQVAVSFYFFQLQSLHQLTLAIAVGVYGYLCIRIFRRAQTDGLSKDQIKFSKWLQFLIILLSVGFLLDLSSIIIGKYYGYWKGSPFDTWLGIPFILLVKIYYATTVYIIALIGYSRFSEVNVRRISKADRDMTEFIPKIIKVMEEDKLYLNPNLTLNSIAEEINMTPGMISAILNSEMKMSYNDFVNSYRVKEVKSKLQTDAINHFTLLALARDSGFKSKTTFYRAFRKFECQSPGDYIKNLNNKT